MGHPNPNRRRSKRGVTTGDLKRGVATVGLRRGTTTGGLRRGIRREI
ncbi:hypothetical protein CEB3_c40590 [Peptococcaceae bacterium CEB3]|nr:hypothetical protein CEB3_c40590 [Peptococcaceae bacterium CEB3]